MVKVISVAVLVTLLPYVSALFIPEYITAAVRKSGWHDSDYAAPIHTSANAKTIENQYIVVFHPHADDDRNVAGKSYYCIDRIPRRKALVDSAERTGIDP